MSTELLPGLAVAGTLMLQARFGGAELPPGFAVAETFLLQARFGGAHVH